MSVNTSTSRANALDKMIIERDVSIPMDDGIALKADVFRPKDEVPAPVIMTLGPYGKGVPYRVGYKAQWDWLIQTYPDILPGSSREFMVWETVDPEIWVPWGYVCIRVDARGAGRSSGKLDILSPRETKDYHDAIEWAGIQPWSTGNVGLNGISYYAINQWAVASLQPSHLKAMIPWEGAADFYRDFARHGGIMSNAFLETWYPRQVLSVQHGRPNAILDPWLKESVTGSESEFDMLNDQQLKENLANTPKDILEHPLNDEYHRQRTPDWSKVVVPFLSAANWGGFGLHPRGNFEAFTQAASKQKWLECHPGRHEEWFYLDHGMDMQKRFLDHFLKGDENGWSNEPSVLLRIRNPFQTKDFELRKEDTWPLSRTKWTPMYLDASASAPASASTSVPTMAWTKPRHETSISFEAMSNNVTFMSTPLEKTTEITGPLAATIYASSSTQDMDLFVTLQAFSPPENLEVFFQGTVDPETPLAQGWLRASHRKLDPVQSKPFRPYHTHDEIQLLEPDKIYELNIEIWPTNIVLPKDYRLALQIGGKDFERTSTGTDNEAWFSKGSGPWLHTHQEDRPVEIFGGKTTLYSGGERGSFLLLPIIED